MVNEVPNNELSVPLFTRAFLLLVLVALAAVTVFAVFKALVEREPAVPSLPEPNAWGHLLHPVAGGSAQPVSMRGPRDEDPASVTNLLAMLGPEQRRVLRERRFTAAICMQGMQDLRNDWSRLQVAGVRATLEALGVQILAVTDAEFEIDRQLADYRHVIALHPDLIVTIPLDNARCAPVLMQAAAQGIRLVFMDSVPEGMQYPRDYSSLIMADSYANGRTAAELIAAHLRGTGTVAMLHWQNRIFTCDQRSLAAREAFARYPGIRVVAEPSFSGVYDIKPLVRQLLDAHPDLGGLWVVWDTPALEALGVIRERGAPTVVASIDLSAPSGLAIAAGGQFIGVGAQHPYQQGVAEALAGAVALAGGTPPPFVVIPGCRITRDNLQDAWQRVLMEPAPQEAGGRLHE